MIQGLDYFYDRQQPRFLEQIVRAFSGLQYMRGASGGNPPMLVQVPCRMASTNRMVGNIIANQSQNSLLTTPMITVWQTGIQGRTEDLQNRNFVDTRQVVERDIDPLTGRYTSDRGQAYTVQRLMPLPFNMLVQVDVWTSNIDQKYQLEEQILTTMWPNFDIQNSENALDWTALTTIYFDDIVHTSRSLPVGTESEIEIMTFNLRLPIWLSPPAMVRQQTLIQTIVTNIGDETPLPGVVSDALSGYGGNLLSQDITTFDDRWISISGDTVTILGPDASTDNGGTPYRWDDYLQQFGTLRPAASQLFLNTNPDFDNASVIVGTLQAIPNNPSSLLWQMDPDTLPSNTLPSVNAVIDPQRSYPGAGGLPAPVEGARYLLVNNLAGPSMAWGQFNARDGDVIQFINGAWTVAWASTGQSDPQYILNLNTGTQLRWTGDTWVLAIDGNYPPGYWKLRI